MFECGIIRSICGSDFLKSFDKPLVIGSLLIQVRKGLLEHDSLFGKKMILGIACQSLQDSASAPGMLCTIDLCLDLKHEPYDGLMVIIERFDAYIHLVSPY